jgi:hypothetical protein
VIENRTDPSRKEDHMSTQKATCPTPRYVLHADRQPIGPDIVRKSPGRSSPAIYGFSDKTAYDAFIGNSEGDLRPYPLMKGYLRSRLAEEHDETCIVIIDANGPVAASVDAATFANVLAAQNTADPQLVSDFQLTFCPASHTYALADAAM